MRYIGGKVMISSWVEAELLKLRHLRHTHYVEPFVGGGAIVSRMHRYFERVTVGDLHPDLVCMHSALTRGWEPPEHCSKEEYQAWRTAQACATRGFIGFCCSFGGKWFGGYARNAHYDFCAHGRAVLLREQWYRHPCLRVVLGDYRGVCGDPQRDQLVYCDPPYAGTTGYGGLPAFNHADFWAWAARHALGGALVVVSEQEAPPGWRCCAERERRHNVGARSDRAPRIERLWILGEQA